jgi:hypothetical protein
LGPMRLCTDHLIRGELPDKMRADCTCWTVSIEAAPESPRYALNGELQFDLCG